MALSEQERRAFIDAASAVISLREEIELHGEKPGGVPPRTQDKAMSALRKVQDVMVDIYRNHKVSTINFRGRLFALGFGIAGRADSPLSVVRLMCFDEESKPVADQPVLLKFLPRVGDRIELEPGGRECEVRRVSFRIGTTPDATALFPLVIGGIVVSD